MTQCQTFTMKIIITQTHCPKFAQHKIFWVLNWVSKTRETAHLPRASLQQPKLIASNLDTDCFCTWPWLAVQHAKAVPERSFRSLAIDFAVKTFNCLIVQLLESYLLPGNWQEIGLTLNSATWPGWPNSRQRVVKVLSPPHKINCVKSDIILVRWRCQSREVSISMAIAQVA